MKTSMFLSGACLAATVMFSVNPLCAATPPGAEAKVNESVFHAVQEVSSKQLDRLAAFTLSYAILSDGTMDAAEKQMLSVLVAEGSKGVKVKGPSGSVATLPSPNAGARHALGLLRSPKNMNEYWLKGDAPMTDMVTLAYLGDMAWARVAKFVASKFYAEWKNSNINNGYAPIRAIINKAYGQGPDAKQDVLLGDAKSALLYDAMKMVDEHEKDKVPDFIYSWLQHDAKSRPFARAPLPIKSKSVDPATRVAKLHKNLSEVITASNGSYFMHPMYALTQYEGTGCIGMFTAEATLFVTQYYQIMVDYRRLKDVSAKLDNDSNVLLTIEGQCAILPYEAKRPIDAAQGAYADCAMVKISNKHVPKSNMTLFGQSMRELASSCVK
ncbi:MAG: hypothetical protein OQL20_03035 [Sedimenticola sp.]|nr:hypothetical protein [Sedimenticola sp.]